MYGICPLQCHMFTVQTRSACESCTRLDLTHGGGHIGGEVTVVLRSGYHVLQTLSPQSIDMPDEPNFRVS